MSLHVNARLLRGNFRLEVDTHLPTQGITALFGRSGCGKTTLLRIIAGLEPVKNARITFNHKPWQNEDVFVPVRRRRLGLVFQESSLLPHLSARRNLLYGYKRTKKSKRRLHPDEIIEMLEIKHLLDRPVSALSGGQRQRIALGRALLTSPSLLLLDEPLSGLDAETKREVIPFLVRLARHTSVPMILVTHSGDEVEQLADHVAFMEEGRVEQIESLKKALSRPDSPLFNDDGPISVLEGEIVSGEAGTIAFQTHPGKRARHKPVQFWLSGAISHRASLNRLRIRASDVGLALVKPTQISLRNLLPVLIREIDYAENQRVIVTCELEDGQLLLSRITREALEELALKRGQLAYALIKSVALTE